MVAPFTGAWIEMPGWTRPSGITWSLPSRERGLKCTLLRSGQLSAVKSLPSRERGLKSHTVGAVRVGTPVAPFTGAWIEMAWAVEHGTSLASLPSRERGLKFQQVQNLLKQAGSLPSRERGLKCKDRTLDPLERHRRSLHGSVD